MRAFTQLYAALDATTRTNEKIAAMAAYFHQAAPADAAWAIFFLRGRRPKRLLGSGLLRQWAADLAGIPDWLLVESYSAVGDSAETAGELLARAEAWLLRRHRSARGSVVSSRERLRAALRAAAGSVVVVDTDSPVLADPLCRTLLEELGSLLLVR